MKKGVPEDAIIPVPRGHTTFESLRAAAPVMKKAGLNSAFLVSDPRTTPGWSGWRGTWDQGACLGDMAVRGDVSGNEAEGYLRETFAYLAYRLLGR